MRFVRSTMRSFRTATSGTPCGVLEVEGDAVEAAAVDAERRDPLHHRVVGLDVDDRGQVPRHHLHPVVVRVRDELGEQRGVVQRGRRLAVRVHHLEVERARTERGHVVDRLGRDRRRRDPSGWAASRVVEHVDPGAETPVRVEISGRVRGNCGKRRRRPAPPARRAEGRRAASSHPRAGRLRSAVTLVRARRGCWSAAGRDFEAGLGALERRLRLGILGIAGQRLLGLGLGALRREGRRSGPSARRGPTGPRGCRRSSGGSRRAPRPPARPTREDDAQRRVVERAEVRHVPVEERDRSRRRRGTPPSPLRPRRGWPRARRAGRERRSALSPPGFPWPWPARSRRHRR